MFSKFHLTYARRFIGGLLHYLTFSWYNNDNKTNMIIHVYILYVVIS